MPPFHPPIFIVNHCGVHSRGKDTLKKSDIRIVSYESLNLIAEPFQIYCLHCQEDFTATTIDVWMYVNLTVRELLFEVLIEEFLSQCEKLDDECGEGLEVMMRRQAND